MAQNSFNCFAGYGQHTINDFLFQLAIHPHTPEHIICQNDKVYDEFKEHLHHYMNQFHGPRFLNGAATVANDNNPFYFNQSSNDEYIKSWVQVFRRTEIFVPKDLYNRYAERGLLDADHTVGMFRFLCSCFVFIWAIGTEYDKTKARKIRCKGETKYARVLKDIHSKTYHIIQAKVPKLWLRGETVSCQIELLLQSSGLS